MAHTLRSGYTMKTNQASNEKNDCLENLSLLVEIDIIFYINLKLGSFPDPEAAGFGDKDL